MTSARYGSGDPVLTGGDLEDLRIGLDMAMQGGNAFNAFVVPEPGSLALWSLGLVGVAGLRRRRSNAALANA